ncbi:oxygen-independent coproporphyrinogen III oxidase [Profundibacter sp.]|uniref:oxygen-independent coproporphyrinogen III oxidase n=1 Tax=Profundibacter sp. TaxID=3101071 RepID=UPI003D14D035
MTGQSQLARLGLFDARVPRYTSYPTAPHFGADVNQSHFTNWVRAIPEGSSISLYLHVPFCRHLCWFCACRTQGTQSEEPVRAYLETLKSELALLKKILPADLTLSRLHWGGGTPTLMTADMISELAGTVLDMIPMAKGGEFSVEIDPNEIDESRIKALAEAGMNRASIGVQDFDEEIQKVIGRIQSYELTKEAADMIRAHGIDSLNADILYGLPHQTDTRIAESVLKLLTLNPSRVALYGYAHVPWMAKRQQLIPTDALPAPEERLGLFDVARKLFMADGYKEIGIDHFALPDDGLAVKQREGHLKRNFQGYTDDTSDVLIGLGASSISKFPQGFAQHASGTSQYTTAVRDGKFATVRGHVFTEDDLLRARMIEALMCDFRINSAEILDKFDITRTQLEAMYKKASDDFEGLPQITAEGFYLPPEARPLTRMVARSFDAYDLSKAGHSSAV